MNKRFAAAILAVLLCLCLVLPVQAMQAWKPFGPPAPVGVRAVWTDNGTLVSWLPALDPLGPPITRFSVYRMDDPIVFREWQWIGDAPANATTYLDPEVGQGELALYSVTAHSAGGTSPASNPAPNGPCELVSTTIAEQYPYLYWRVRPHCIVPTYGVLIDIGP